MTGRCPACRGTELTQAHQDPADPAVTRRGCLTDGCRFFGPAEAFESRPAPDPLLDEPNPNWTIDRIDEWLQPPDAGDRCPC